LNRLRSRRPVVALFVALAGLLIADSGYAQIDEIIVTARKREENLQDVPVAVTAFTRESIERRGIRRVGDIAKLTPSLQFDESFAQSDTRIVIRGLSPTRGRQNVAVLVDGIDLSSEAITSSGGSLLVNTRLLDVERIEVIKGPQLALYGRSAFNGALQYVTKEPADEFEADVRVDINAENQFNGDGSVSFPVFGDTLGVRLNGAIWDNQGFYDNQLTGNSVGDQEGWGLALSTRSAFDNGLTLKFRGEYTSDEGKPSPQTFLPFARALDVPESAQDVPGGANLAQCYENFIREIGNPDQNVPPFFIVNDINNDERLVNRARRIIDPALATSLGFPDLNDPSVTPADYRAVVLANPFLSPHCEDRFLGYGTTGNPYAIPDADEITLRQATDPRRPGQDYAGFERDLWRISLTGEWAFEKGTVNFWAGYLNDDNVETQDSNSFGVPSSNAFRDANVNAFSFNNEKETEQINLELRYSTSFDGPVNFAVGATVWQEEVDNNSRSITVQASGSHCSWSSFPPPGFISAGLENSCPGYTETLAAGYLAAADPFRPPSPADRDTDHKSAYFQLEWAVADALTLNFEGRYNDEQTDVFGPIFYDPDSAGGPGGLNPCGIFFRPCEPFSEDYEFADQFDPVADPTLLGAIPEKCLRTDPAGVARSIAFGPQDDANDDGVPNDGVDLFNPWCVDSLTQNQTWFLPSVTVDWRVTDDALVYFKWSKSQKPGGFSLLTVGSVGLDRDLAEFKPEKMTVWETGAKSEWLDRTLRVNGAVFFQDYTDKQALTSEVVNDRLVSKIENAGSAEVWGAEIEVTWQPEAEFLGGAWLLTGGYTWLDTEYTDFRVNSTSAVRAASAGNCTPRRSDPNGPFNLCEISYTGNSLEDAADGAFAGSIRYDRQVTSAIGLYIETDVQWTDKRFTDIENAAFVQAFWNTDLRIGLQGENWEVLAYVNNLFDDDTVRFTGGGPGLGCCFVLGSGIDFSGAEPPAADTVMVDLPLYASAFLPPPRVVGMRASYRFGGPQ